MIPFAVEQMMDFSKSHCPTTTFFDSDTEDEDDDFLSVSRAKIPPGSSLPPSFGTWNSSFKNHGSSAEVCKNRNGRYDQISLVTKINKIMEENEKSILHAVEVASASVTQLESRTNRLENSMDDLKVYVEFNHGRTSRNLMELESILKKVHTDVKFLLDKQDIAETELQLLKLQRYRTKPEPETQNPDIQTALPQQKQSPSSGYSYQQLLDPHTCVQPDSLLPSAYANVSPYLIQGSEMSFSPPHESYYSSLVQPPCFTSAQAQYTPNHQQFEPYLNSVSYNKQSPQPDEFGRQQEQSALHSFGVSDQSLIPANTKSAPPSSAFYSQNSYDDFATHSLMKSSQALPNAIPRAYFLDTDDQSGSSGKANKTSNEEIVEEVIAMGFRRDMVTAAVRKLTQKQESVDLNTLLDKLMN